MSDRDKASQTGTSTAHEADASGADPLATLSMEDDAELLASAYVDGELSGEQLAAFEAGLSSSDELRAMVEDYRRINQGLRHLHAELLSAPAPSQHLELLESTARKHRPVWPWAMAAGLAGLLVGAAGGWFGAISGFPSDAQNGAATVAAGPAEPTDSRPVAIPTAVEPRPVAQEAALAHAIYTREKRHAVEVPANESRHLNTWLSRRLAQPVEAPDLRPLGFDLVGGRLLADAGRPAAQFMFENAAQQRLTLFIRSFVNGRVKPGGGPIPETAEYVKSDGLGVWFWPQSGLYYALTGPLDKTELLAVVDRIRSAPRPASQPPAETGSKTR
ncbi:MAG: anti-sigma factor [Gammaproteobacteria bacterium]|nr:anti-sigma factor [Gammaproteobacteria bacterium]